MWKIPKEIGMPDHLTCLLKNPVASTVLMEGTCPNSWILPRIHGVWSVPIVSSWTLRGIVPKDRAGWHLQHRQEVRLLQAVA